MAQRATESTFPPAGDDKLPAPVESDHDVEEQQPRALAAPEEDYPVERVEAVYRKLDLRIIPGLTHHRRLLTVIAC